MPVNLDKPQHWKADVAQSVDMYNDWFMRFAPQAFRTTRVQTTKDVEAALWHRFSIARNSFDKARRTHFAALDSAHEQAKTTKERLVAEAERMAGSRDWMATAGAFKRLMDDWRAAGRAGRAEDDALWQRLPAQSERYRQQLHFWQSVLGDGDYQLELPTDHPRRAERRTGCSRSARRERPAFQRSPTGRMTRPMTPTMRSHDSVSMASCLRPAFDNS